MAAAALPVSVVIPAYNAAATIARALDSVLAQTCPPLEVIVVDDGSGDATAEVVGAYAPHAVRLLSQPANAGVSAARNAGIAAASGALVAFLDADDAWLPGKLAAQVPLFAADPCIVLATCDTAAISLDGKPYGVLFGGEFPPPGPDAWRRLLARNVIHTSSVVARRDALLAVGCFDPALRVSEDQHLWIRLALHGHLQHAKDTLVQVTFRPDSLSSGGWRVLVDVTMPMIQRLLAEQRDRLSGRERRAILRERWARIGRSAYSQGDYRDGLRLLGHAMLLGEPPLPNLLFVLGGTPPARRLKRLVRARGS